MAKKKDTLFIDISDVQNKVNEMLKDIKSTKPLENTIKDMYNRAPGKVIDAVRTVYNIKKSDIVFKKYTEARRDFHYTRDFSKSGGNVKGEGHTVATFKLVTEGEALTPLHFGMTPKSKPDKKKYKVKAKIKKGKTKVFEPQKEKGGVFLAPNPKKPSQILPWERYSGGKYDISPIKTMSFPQMVGPNPENGIGGNSIVMEQINKDLAELLLKRLHHHVERHLEKATKK